MWRRRCSTPGYRSVSLSLGDLQQQSFWIVVGEKQRTRIEVLGRALADVRLWREGRDLVTQPARREVIAPVAVHPLTRILVDDTLPAGTYLVTAYGGPALPWSDGAAEHRWRFARGRRRSCWRGG